MIRNLQSQTVGAQMISATTGAAFAGAVTVYVTGDAGTQVLGSVGGGACTLEGNGYYTYRPTAAETDFAQVAFTFVGSGAIPATIEIDTLTQAQALTGTVTAAGAVTVLRELTRALQDLGVLQKGEVPDAEDAQLGLDTLNDWLDDLKTQSLSVYTISRVTWAMTTATSYTIGIGATINIDRPVSPQDIRDVGYINTANGQTAELLLGPVLTQDAYDALAIKSYSAQYPSAFYYNPTFGATGFGTLSPYPVPSVSGLTGVIYAPSPVSEFGSIHDVMALPPGYRRFFRSNLALELAAPFGVTDIPPSVVQAASESRTNVKRANVRLSDMTPDTGMFGGGGRSNIYLG